VSNYTNIYITAEHCGLSLKSYLIQQGAKNGYNIIDLYDVDDPTDDYPTVAKILASKLQSEPEAIGIAMCGSGQGINMCLNRFHFIRSALISSPALAKQARQHGSANVITLGANYITQEEAWNCLLEFLTIEPSLEPRHMRRTAIFSDPNYTEL
jgi:ribose 5-phosphate isomerase B